MKTYTLYGTLALLLVGLCFDVSLAQEEKEDENNEERVIVIERKNDDGPAMKRRHRIRTKKAHPGGDYSVWVDRDDDNVTVIVDGDTLEGDAKIEWLSEHDMEGHDGPMHFKMRRPGPGAFAFHFDDDDFPEVEFDMDDLPFGNMFFRDGDDGEHVFSLNGDMGRFMRWNHNAEVMKMESKARKLARKARKAEGAEADEAEAELDALLAEIFAKKQADRQERIEHLEAELAKEKEELQARMQAEQDIIERRKKQLLGKRDRLDW